MGGGTSAVCVSTCYVVLRRPLKPNSPQDQSMSVTGNLRQAFIPRVAPVNAQGIILSLPRNTKQGGEENGQYRFTARLWHGSGAE